MRANVVVVMLVILLSACAAKTPESFKQDKPLYEYATRLYEEGDYSASVPFFESLRNRFPTSPYAIDSELKLADALYKSGSYGEAEVSYQSFRSLHPTHAKIPYVLYQIGMTHVKRAPRSVDRDLSQSEKALEAFRELIAQYPNAPQVKDARQRIQQSKRALEERELYVADFYLKQSEYGAALHRLRELNQRSEFKDLQIEASYKLGYAYYKLENAKDAIKVLQKVAADPKAGQYKQRAKALLRKAMAM